MTSQEFVVKALIPKKEILIRKEEKITAQKLFNSLTSNHQELLNIDDEEHIDRISILDQLITINRHDTWATTEPLDDGLKRLLPSWSVLQYPLKFQEQKHNRIFHIFPEQVALGAKAGKGYMSAKLEHNSVKIYAAWNSDHETNMVWLWLMMPQEDNIKSFSTLDEWNLWPAYQCVDCGMIVGSKNGDYLKLSPQTTIAHRHEKTRSLREQFLDVVYGVPIEVKVLQYKEKKMWHYYWANEVVGDNYFNDLFDGREHPLHDNINIPINTFDATDYYIAMSETYENYKKRNFKITLQQIIGKETLFEEIKKFVLENEKKVPAFSAALRLDQQIKSKKRLYFLPKYILLLGLVLRLKAHNPKIYENFLNKNTSLEREIISLTYQAMSACPKLLEWSIAWVEIFFNHTIS